MTKFMDMEFICRSVIPPDTYDGEVKINLESVNEPHHKITLSGLPSVFMGREIELGEKWWLYMAELKSNG